MYCFQPHNSAQITVQCSVHVPLSATCAGLDDGDAKRDTNKQRCKLSEHVITPVRDKYQSQANFCHDVHNMSLQGVGRGQGHVCPVHHPSRRLPEMPSGQLWRRGRPQGKPKQPASRHRYAGRLGAEAVRNARCGCDVRRCVPTQLPCLSFLPLVRRASRVTRRNYTKSWWRCGAASR